MLAWKLFSTVVVLTLLVTTSFGLAQAGSDFSALSAMVGAGALSMGGAFTAIADNQDATSWNPAGLANVSSQEISTMQTRLSTDADQYYLSYATKLFNGTLGISWTQISLGDISQTTSTDAFNEVITTSIFSYFSNAYLLAYGLPVNQNLSLGLTAKYLSSDMTQISGGQAYGYSLTPGILFHPMGFPGVSVGLKIDELLSEQKWGTGAVEKSPAKARLGVAVSRDENTFALDVSQVLQSMYSPEYSLGYQWKKHNIALRLGILGSAITAGAGFGSGNATLDYAYVQQEELSRDNVHRISLSGKW